MKTKETRERRRRPEMKQIVTKSKVPSATGAEGIRKVVFDAGSVNGKLELKSRGTREGDDKIVEPGINGKDDRDASEPLPTKKGDFLIEKVVMVVGG